MSTVTIVSPKGGVSKTLASICAACALAERGYRVTIVDFDIRSASLSKWLERRLKNGRSIPDGLEVLTRDEIYDKYIQNPDDFAMRLIPYLKERVNNDPRHILFIDLAGTKDEFTTQTMMLADLLISPIGNSAADLDGAYAAYNSWEALQKLRTNKFRFMMNRRHYQPGFASSEELDTIKELFTFAISKDVEALESGISERDAYKKLYRLGLTPNEVPSGAKSGHNRHGEVQKEVNNFVDELCDLLALPVPEPAIAAE